MELSISLANKVLFSIGSNLYNKKQNIKSALEYLECVGIKNLLSSSQYITEPVGNTEQDYFYNIAAIGYTSLAPNILLFLCKSIEYSIGRRSSGIKWAARALDIDIILYENIIIKHKYLTIPHAYFKERKFVLIPTSELDENLLDPISNKNIKELLYKCTDTSKVLMC